MKKILLLVLIVATFICSFGISEGYKSLTQKGSTEINQVEVYSFAKANVKEAASITGLLSLLGRAVRAVAQIIIAVIGGGGTQCDTNKCPYGCNADGTCKKSGGGSGALTNAVNNSIPYGSLVGLDGRTCQSLIGTESNTKANRIACIAKAQVSKVKMDCYAFASAVYNAAGASISSSNYSGQSGCSTGDWLKVFNSSGTHIHSAIVIGGGNAVNGNWTGGSTVVASVSSSITGAHGYGKNSYARCYHPN